MEANDIYKPHKYYALTFILTYIFWTAGAIASHKARGSLYMILMLAGLIIPFIISLIMTFSSKNKAMIKDYFNRLFNIKLINMKIIPLYFLIMPASVLLSVSISLLFGGSPDQFEWADGFSFSTGIVPVLTLLLLAAGFEELGWRGYAFDSLQSRFSNFKASLYFSILWSIWHLPLIFVKDSYQYEILNENIIYGINFFVSIIPMGFIISWICIKNRKSVFSAILFHFIVNMSQEMLAITQETKCIQTFVLTGFTALIILYDRKLFFNKIGIKFNQEKSSDSSGHAGEIL